MVSYLKSQGITKLYHFTDKSNIQSIIDNGGIYSWHTCNTKGIHVSRPGGSYDSHNIDSYLGLDNYVRLSFTRNHPMMYVAKNDGRISNPVILEIDLTVAGLSSTKFSDKNAAKRGAVIQQGYNGAKNIHFYTVKQPNHFNLSSDEKDYYQAEVLVYEKIPLSFITNIDQYRPGRQTTYSGSSSSYGSSSSSRPSYSSYSSSSSSTSSSSDQSSGSGCIVWIVIGVVILLLAGLCS